MYLTKHTYIGANYPHNGITGTIDLSKNGEKIDIDLNKVSYVVEAVGYWRKANQIHAWFVDNVQGEEDDCRLYKVSGEKLKELRDICVDVLKKRDDEYSQEQLPPVPGFFFGGTNINDYYYDDIKHTIAIIDVIEANDPGFKEEYYYQSSW